MTKRKKGETHHVVPNPNGGWDVKRGGSLRATSHHETKTDAISSGREVSRNQHTEFKIHNKGGRISQSDSHGHDPRSVKG
jgi:hypothetical protein